jgi:hypothetical protein
MDFRKKIFGIRDEDQFNEVALEVFRSQFASNEVYREFVGSLGVNAAKIKDHREIPFMPVEFFKSRNVVTGDGKPEIVFHSSGTTGMTRSSHYISEVSVYINSLGECFRLFYGDPGDYSIFALTPSPAENPGSSLAFMIARLMEHAGNNDHGFFLHDPAGLKKRLEGAGGSAKKVMLFGLSYALLDFIALQPVSYPDLIIMETGGMKGRRKEMIREELHDELCRGFGVHAIHSEYGMTELLSQAYSKGNGIFMTPPWMKILVRDTNDPFHLLEEGNTGGISIIDLANFNSSSFLATQDIGKRNPDGTFEVLGRFDYSDTRGCNLMAV